MVISAGLSDSDYHGMARINRLEIAFVSVNLFLLLGHLV